MSELPDGIEPAEPAEPRPSASGIVVRTGADGRARVLLGLRARSSRFLPGHLAFPGGGVEPQDGPSGAEAFARCVARELHEEAGLAVAPARWVAVGERTTPPLFPVRFHTRFFAVDAGPGDAPADPAPANGENESLGFLRPAEVLARFHAGTVAVPPPVLPLLRELDRSDGEPFGEVVEGLRRVNAEEERAPRIEFVPGVWVFPVRTPTLPPATHTNVWMPGGERFAIVDPGAEDPAELERLLRVVERRRATGAEPEAVLLTHAHRDHAAGAREVGRRLGLPIRGAPEVLARLGLGTAGLALADGDVLDLRGLRLVVVATPGHGAGHLCFHMPALGALIAGDLVSGISTILVDPAEGDMGSYLESLERADGLGCTRLLPGHGPPLPGSELPRVLEHRRRREARILAGIGPEPRPLARIAAEAYDDQPQLPAALVQRQALAHLVHLERAGRIRRLGHERDLQWTRATG